MRRTPDIRRASQYWVTDGLIHESHRARWARGIEFLDGQKQKTQESDSAMITMRIKKNMGAREGLAETGAASGIPNRTGGMDSLL